MPSPDRGSRPVRVLVTGAGGPAAIAVMRSLSADPSVRVIAADMDSWAAGLYLVPSADRTLIPAGAAPGFARSLLERCQAMAVNVVVPTVDAELRPLSRARGAFTRAGIQLMLAPDRGLAVTLDKLALASCCAGTVRVPRTEPFDDELDPGTWKFPVVVKPRRGSGSRDISVVPSGSALAELPRSADFLVQEYLSGEEYSIDVFADRVGHVVAAVPRLRAKVDSGISVAGRTVHDAGLERFGAAVAEVTGLEFIANIQARRDQAGRPALLEVNPRAPGSLALTIASGVDMPRFAMTVLRGGQVPEHADFREVAMVRFLDERIVELGELQRAAA
ncbi:MAG TPA: ATP-grasp domain-containing protein [Streptosporangiaceae bacterium]|nr:ATP-grasp domain-containing protein [Streptosporangiaceae bacterium]